MSSEIWQLKEGDPDPRMLALFSVPPKMALVCFIMQTIYHNFIPWKYPEEIEGMRESGIVKDCWYYDDIEGKRVICSYPVE